MDVKGFFKRKQYQDPTINTDFGKALFLAGVTLGVVAEEEDPGKRLHALLSFGDVKLHEFKKAISEVPLLVGRNFNPEESEDLLKLLGVAMVSMMENGSRELEVEDNFILSMGYVGGRKLFDEIRGGACQDEVPDHR